MKPKTSRLLLIALIGLLSLSACTLFPRQGVQIGITPVPVWTPLAQKTEKAFVIEQIENVYPFDDTVLIFFKTNEEDAYQGFDLTTGKTYDFSALPTTSLSSAPLTDPEGRLILQFGHEIHLISENREYETFSLPSIADATVRCEFPFEGRVYCLNADLTQAFVLEPDLTVRSIPLDQPQQEVDGEFYPLYRTSEDQVWALYTYTLPLVLDQGVYFRSFDLASEMFEDKLLKMHLDIEQSPEALALAQEDPENNLSTMEPIQVLGLPENLSRAYINMWYESMFVGLERYNSTSYINLATGTYARIDERLENGLPEGSYFYRDRLVIPRKVETDSIINFSWPEAFDLKAMRRALDLADWIPAEEPLMEIFPYREGWLLLTSETLYYTDYEGIIYRRFNLSPQVSELLLTQTPHILTQPIDP